MLHLSDRATSGFPLSISTALAFESLFPPRKEVYDPSREIPQKIVLGNYSELWINLDTLFRNMLQAADKLAVTNTSYGECAITLNEEMDVILSLLKNEGYGRTKAVFYLCDYEEALKKRHKAIEIRKQENPHQLFIEKLRKDTMRYLESKRDDITKFKGAITVLGIPSVALMLTHIPYDLLSKGSFAKLDLLESNTGRLKTSMKWNTKYYPIPNRDMSILPWHRILLFALGDKVLIKPQSMKIRHQIHDTAINRKWTPATTLDKVRLDLSLDMHPFDYTVIQSF